jgi:hypothetical protein
MKARHGNIAQITCLILILSLQGAAWASPSANETATKSARHVLVVRQKTESMGPIELYLSDQAGHFSARGGELTATCAAPDWNLVFYSKRRNLAFVASRAKMQQKSMGIFHRPPLEQGVRRRQRDSQLKLDTLKVTIDGSADPEGSNDLVIFQARKSKRFKEIDFVVADHISLNPNIQIFVNWLYDQSVFPGVPLEQKKYYTDGSASTVYRTTSITHADQPASLFEYPKGYKRTANFLEVVLSEDAKSTLEHLWGDRN